MLNKLPTQFAVNTTITFILGVNNFAYSVCRKYELLFYKLMGFEYPNLGSSYIWYWSNFFTITFEHPELFVWYEKCWNENEWNLFETMLTDDWWATIYRMGIGINLIKNIAPRREFPLQLFASGFRFCVEPPSWHLRIGWRRKKRKRKKHLAYNIESKE